MWDTDPRLYLLPWTALVALVAAIPLAREAQRRSGFDAFSPIVFAVFTHLIPAFVLGSLVLVAGWRPWFFYLIPDPDLALPLTMFYTSVGFGALTLGFALPSGQRLGRRLTRRLPQWNWQPEDVLAPALGLLAIAGALTALAFRFGLAGYQEAGSVGNFDAAILIAAYTTGSTAAVLLWIVVFRTDRPTRARRLALLTLSAWILADLLFSGRRAALVQATIFAAGAFWLSGRRVRLRQAAVFGIVAFSTVVVGFAYGTTFRLVKGSEVRIALGEYPRLVVQTMRVTADRGLIGNATFVFRHLAERIEGVTSAAVVVANYERLAPFEPALGLSNSIVSGLVSALVPRVLWPEKPAVSDPRTFAVLYFGYRNSFAVTPGADLLRNFGPWSIPIGMALLGWLLRVLYAALIEDLPVAIWRSTAYLVLLPTVSYEGFFGQIVPQFLRTAFVLAACLALVEGVRRLWVRAPS